MNNLSKNDLINLLKVSNFLDNDEINQLIKINKKMNLNDGDIFGSLKKIGNNKDILLNLRKKFDILSDELKIIKKLVNLFGNDYDLFSYLVKFPNKIDDDSFKDFFRNLSNKENSISYLKKIIEELNTQDGGNNDDFLDIYDNITYKNNTSNFDDSSEIEISNIDSENINAYFNFSDTLESDKYSFTDLSSKN